MVEILFDEKFKKYFSKIKDNLLKTKIIKQLEKLKDNPSFGKPMRNVRKGTRELYIKPFRLSYAYLSNENKIIILNLYHKNFQ
ncbi:MAG: type II toxin-antitoxin system RelE/ParE family toxin [Nanoarchaeota archaeon]|nr:type II toxin-antitoxin system RelE/ParE family toxin [Nanoarchaeota archaeon]